MEGQEAGSDLVGRQFGEFVVRERLGVGGFGMVYRAEQPALAREAVIKVLHRRLLGSEQLVQRFLREARLASRLDHPYAAHTYAFGAEPDGVLWIAMEYVRGTPLDRMLEAQGPIALERFVPLLERICEVVASAHEQGIVHRDLKPANVMVLSRAGRLLPKLLDLGIAKLEGSAAELPASGTPPRAPETPTRGSRPPAGAALDATALGTEPGAAGAMTVPLRGGGPSAPPAWSTSADLSGSGRLTGVGVVMGSPLYMAPEQWADAGAVDGRSDLYALGVLCYECLTGRVPFDGVNEYQIAIAHARQPPPPLGGSLPRELDAVLARALAKEPASRYGSALDLATAFRAASGVAAETVNLPHLPEAVRALALAEAPQPIALAIEALDAARNAHQARDALWLVVRTAVRLVGVAALASHAHVGGDRGGGAALNDALRRLRERALSDAGWLELARALTAPFADLCEAHPLPELVALLDRRRPSALAELVALRDEAGGGSETDVRDLLERALPLLARALGELSLFGDRPLVIPVAGGGAELWMGARQGDRAWRQLSGRASPVDHPLLVDADGAPVVSLWPFVQLHEPAPGAPPALFFFEGRGRRGARLIALPDAFEHDDEEPWEALGVMLRDAHEDAGRAAAQETCPFPGLAAFGATDAASFFGRERETQVVVNRLQVTPILAVVGPSGAGKSSFVQAGVLPALQDGWRSLTMRPGAAPLVSLAARLDALGVDASHLRAELTEHPGALGAALRAFAQRTGARLVLVVDQLEELFTLCEDSQERTLFADALARAARSADDPVRVIVTLRDDFLLRAEALPALSSRLGASLHLLTTPAPAELRRILCEPVRAAGYEFDDPALPDEMVEEVAAAPGALALLSFTASKLWELRDRRFRHIARKSYRSLGGVGGALAQHAETTLAAMPAEEQRLVREVFRHAVTAEGTRAVLTRDELGQILGGGAHALAVLEKLIAARLLVASDGESGQERVEITHEALLVAWPRLVTWRREDAEGSRLRDQLRAAARQWDERGRPGGLLWRDDALVDYRRWRARYPGNLAAAEEAFAAASLAVEARGRRRRRAAAVFGFAGLLAAVVLLLWMNGRTARERADAVRSRSVAVDAKRSAEQHLLQVQVELGREALLARDYARAAAYLNEAFERGVDTPALRFMLAQAVRPLRLRPAVLDHGGPVERVSFSPDGARAVTTGESPHAIVWSRTGQRQFELALGGEEVTMADFTPDGRAIVVIGRRGTVARFRAEDGAPLSREKRHELHIWSLAFSPDGTRFATASGDARVVVWATDTGAPLITLTSPQQVMLELAWSPDGARLVSAGVDGTACVWDPARGRLLHTLFGSRDHMARSVAVSPDGELVALAVDRAILLWRLRDGARLGALSGHAAAIMQLSFAPDGRLLSASVDGTAKVWDARGGRLLASLEGHKGSVSSAAWSPTGDRILTASDDGTGRLWDPRGALLGILSGHRAALAGGVFDARGAVAGTASQDGTARLWPVEVTPPIGVATGHRSLIVALRFNEDGSRFITTSRDRTARVWDTRTRAELARFDTASPTAFAALAGPDDLAVIGDDRRLVVRSAGGAPVATLELPFHLLDLRAAPGGRRLFGLSPLGDLVLIDLVARNVRPLELGGSIESADFGADGATLAVAHDDGRVELWDVDRAVRLREIVAHERSATTVRFCGDHTRLLTAGNDGTVKLWDVASGGLLSSFVLKPGHRFPEPAPDCWFVAVAGDGYPLVVLDATDGRLLDHVEARAGETFRVVVSPDGRKLLAPDGDLVWMWDLEPPGALDSQRRIARCAVDFRVEGAQLVRAERDPACDEP